VIWRRAPAVSGWQPKECLMPITALYAGLLAPLFMFLAVRVIGLRRGAKVAVGDGGDKALLRRMRVHANFAEYVPLALLLMALAESLNTWPWVLHLTGLVLLGGRLLHAYGMSQPQETFAFRVLGMTLTFSVIGAAAAACIIGALARMLAQ
jgi:uncharacterized membrane protein YecN with MAPEG domain